MKAILLIEAEKCVFKNHNVRLSLQIMPRVKITFREREMFLFYRTSGIKINYQLLKYWNLRKQPLLRYYFKSSVVCHFVANLFLRISRLDVLSTE